MKPFQRPLQQQSIEARRVQRHTAELLGDKDRGAFLAALNELALPGIAPEFARMIGVYFDRAAKREHHVAFTPAERELIDRMRRKYE